MDWAGEEWRKVACRFIADVHKLQEILWARWARYQWVLYMHVDKLLYQWATSWRKTMWQKYKAWKKWMKLYKTHGLSNCYSSIPHLTQLLEMTNVQFTPTWCHAMGPKSSSYPFTLSLPNRTHIPECPGTTCTSAFREPQAVKWRKVAVNKRLG
jgi:hypothetical protein